MPDYSKFSFISFKGDKERILSVELYIQIFFQPLLRQQKYLEI